MVFLASKIWVKLTVDVAAYLPIFLNKSFGLAKVEALCIYELRVGIQKSLAFAHFEEAVDDEDEFPEIGRKSSANDIFLTLATDFQTEAPAREHHFQNCSLPNCDAPV
jgi:hypothetical protein